MAFTFGTPISYAYAEAYAIQTSPLTNHEEDGDVTTFLGDHGRNTVWPSAALHFDDAEHALAKKLTLRDVPKVKGEDGEWYPRIVRIRMKCDIEPVAIEIAKA